MGIERRNDGGVTVNPTDVDQQIAGALGTLAPEPPPIADLADRVGARIRRRARIRLRGAVAGIAVVAVLVAVPLTVGRTTRDGALPPPAPVYVGAAGQQAAQRQNDVMLGAFSLPPHVTALSGPPSTIEVPPPPDFYPNPQIVSASRWWLIPSRLNSAITWLNAHRPSGSAPLVRGSGTDHGVLTTYLLQFVWPDVTGVLVNQSLSINLFADGSHTVIWEYATSTWLPVRSPVMTIPASVVAVVVTLHTKGKGYGSPDVPVQTFGPARITDDARVTDVVALVNSLSPATPMAGPHSCPVDIGGDMSVAFVDAAGRTRDTLITTLTGCRTNTLTAADGSTLEIADSDHGLPSDIRSRLGLDWTWPT